MQEFIQTQILPNLWGAIVGVVGVIWGYFRSMPKERIEKDGGIVENAKKVLEMSEDIAERLEKQLLASDGVISALREKLQIAIESENTCKKALKAIKEEYANFQLLFHDQKIELDALRDECKRLRLAIENKENEGNNINNTLRDN